MRWTAQQWGIDGPATVRCLMNAHRGLNSPPRQRHWWWRNVQSLDAGDPGVQEHFFLSEVLELALCHDRLNISRLQSFEVIARRYQLWEDTYVARLRASECGASSVDELDEQMIFLGGRRSKGHALVCPKLDEFVSSCLEQESAVLKQKRKGREEKRLAREAGIGADVPLGDQPSGPKKPGKKGKKDKKEERPGGGGGS